MDVAYTTTTHRYTDNDSTLGLFTDLYGLEPGDTLVALQMAELLEDTGGIRRDIHDGCWQVANTLSADELRSAYVVARIAVVTLSASRISVISLLEAANDIDELLDTITGLPGYDQAATERTFSDSERYENVAFVAAGVAYKFEDTTGEWAHWSIDDRAEFDHGFNDMHNTDARFVNAGGI